MKISRYQTARNAAYVSERCSGCFLPGGALPTMKQGAQGCTGWNTELRTSNNQGVLRNRPGRTEQCGRRGSSRPQ
eukprot:5109451-Pyramimonas_sp.AAC.1